MRRFAGLFVALMLISACSWPAAQGPADVNLPAAGRIISEIHEANNRLRPFKGLGNIRIEYGEIRLSARAAWIADPNARCLRMEIMGPVGRTTARLIVNGSSAVFSWYDKGRFRSRTLNGRSLDPLVHIPVCVDAFILFLSGSIPVKAHDRIAVDRSGHAERHVLVLKKRWRGMVEKIGFIPGKSEITDVEVYGWLGSLYRVDIISNPDAESGHPFSAMIFSDGDVRVRIEPDRQWRDVRIPENAFDTGAPAP